MNFYIIIIIIIIIQMHIILSYVWHGHDLWSMVYGLWSMVYSLWSMDVDVDVDVDVDMDIPNKTQYIMCILIII